MDISELRQYASPEALRAALTARGDQLRQAGHAHHPDQASVRTTRHRGHEIVVRTSYSITVDGQPFHVQPSVNNAGLVHYHGLPTQSFPSVLDLVKSAIDTYWDDFATDGTSSAPHHAPEHDSHH
jgi:hypothetical protein